MSIELASALNRLGTESAFTVLAEAKKLDKHGMLADQVKLMQQQMKRI